MVKIVEQWLLFKYVDGEFTLLSRPLKAKKLAEKERKKCGSTFRQDRSEDVSQRLYAMFRKHRA
jgi:hypothetical protein